MARQSPLCRRVEAPDRVRGDRVPRRRLLSLFAIIVPLAACGFTPLHGPDRAATAIDGRIAVALIDGEMGFEARTRLTERLGQAQRASHRLVVTLSVDSAGLAISQTNQITRYNLSGLASYRLIALAAETAVDTGTVRAFAAYSADDSAFATQVAERDARRRLAISLADQIATRLAATADRWQ